MGIRGKCVLLTVPMCVWVCVYPIDETHCHVCVCVCVCVCGEQKQVTVRSVFPLKNEIPDPFPSLPLRSFFPVCIHLCVCACVCVCVCVCVSTAHLQASDHPPGFLHLLLQLLQIGRASCRG